MRKSSACFFVILLAGCTSQSGPATESPGLAGAENRQLGPGHYQILIPLNGLTDQRVVDELFRRRATELCGGGKYTALNRNGASGDANQVFTGSTHKFPAIAGEVQCVKAG